MLAALTCLALDCPLIASLPITLAINLDISYIVFMPVLLVYCVASIIVNSPAAYIVKQIDHIVWKVIFLILYLILQNAAIWWPYITQSKEQAEQ